jgi:hypothetical protein
LLDAVVRGGYSGEPWEELARRLVTRALLDLERSIRNGSVYGRCRRAGFGIARREELQRHPLAGDIAAEAVGECLERFRNVVLPAGEWDPDRGRTLEDFFAALCVRDVANRWRSHLRQLPACAIELDALDEPGQAGVLALVTEPPPDPAAVAEARDDLARVMAPMSPADRLSFVLRERGWSPAEIAGLLGISRNALDARMHRARKTAQEG